MIRAPAGPATKQGFRVSHNNRRAPPAFVRVFLFSCIAPALILIDRIPCVPKGLEDTRVIRRDSIPGPCSIFKARDIWWVIPEKKAKFELPAGFMRFVSEDAALDEDPILT